MKENLKGFGRTKSIDIGITNETNAGRAASLKKQLGKAAMLMLLVFLSMTRAHAQITVTLSTPTPVTASSMCPGTSQQTIYAFTLVAAGIPSLTTQFTGMSFTLSGTATGADITQYKLWSGSAGGTLVATSTNTSFSGFSNTFSGLTGTTINYWVTADVSPSATAGRTIAVDPMTTANFTTTSGLRTTFGTIAAGGAQTVLLAPGPITGTTSVCVGATTTLGNAISGGTWTFDLPTVGIINPTTGIVTGVAAGMSGVHYQLSTGCSTSANVAVNALPALYIVTGGGSYCAGDAGVHVGLSGSAAGVYYQLYCGSATSGDPEGTGAALDFGLQTAAGVYSVIATNTSTGCVRNMIGTTNVAINPLPTVYATTGGGSYCSGGSGLHVGVSGTNTGVNYRLYNGSTPIGAPMAGTGTALDLGNYTAPGTYSVMATNTATGCTNDMAGNATIIVNPLPTVYTVLGGGSFCAGDAGVHIRLSWSQVGVIYVLYNGGVTVGSPVAGTGILLDFGLQNAPGNYTVVAMNAATYCTRNMSGSATISVNPVPTVYAVTGGGSYCAGGTGLHVGLTTSNPGVMYMLYNGGTITGSPVSGTGSSIDFGLQTAAGTYTVMAVNSATTCMNNMAGNAVISINPLPTVYSVTGGGIYCASGAGIHVGLSASNTGINYQLYNSGAAIGSPVSGTGASLDFGLQTLAGIYSVIATNSTTMCIKNMSATASVNINPLPPLHNITGGGYYCVNGPAGTTITETEAGSTAIHIGLDGSDVGMIYLLYNGPSTVGSPLAGTGGALDFGTQYTSGTYSILAMDATTLCTQVMTGTRIISINSKVVANVTAHCEGGTTKCFGMPANFIALTGNAGALPSYLWKVNGVTVGTTSGSYSYVPANGDIVYVAMTSSIDCAEPVPVSDTAVIEVIAPVVPLLTISAHPGTHIAAGETIIFTADITNGGVAPICKWFINGNQIISATTSTFICPGLSNGDTVSCSVTRNDDCALSSSKWVVISVGGLGVSPADEAGNNITVMPNPSNGTFTVTGSLNTTGNAAAILEVTNMMGQVVYKRDMVTVNGTINEQIKLGAAAAGMYILNIHTANENMAMHIVIE